MTSGALNATGLTIAINATGAGLIQAEYVLVDATAGGTLTGPFAGVTGADGYELNYDTPKQVKLVQSSGGTNYATWASGFAGLSDPSESLDFDKGGLESGIEYVVGGDPTDGSDDVGKAPTTIQDGSNLIFSFKRDQDSIAAGTAVTIEVDTNLSTWPDSYTVATTTADSTPGVTVSQNDPVPGMDTVTLTVPKASDAKKFTRLKVVITP